MSGLPRPDLPRGAHRDLVDALHELHHRAGWPSLRKLAAAVGVSHTTVSGMFSSARLPSWGALELLVEALNGDVVEFRTLWLAAGSDDGATLPAPIAGRAAELAAIRRRVRHPGLILITGEAGIGKTRLVGAVVPALERDGYVATGACRPLSARMPLLPFADALNSVWASDGAGWFQAALTSCPPYVTDALTVMLPELDAAAPASGDEWARHRLFAAVGVILAELARLQPLTLVLEDLHWADPTTLDLVEHLAVRSPPVPLLCTWRVDDPATSPDHDDWLIRMRRLPTTHTLALGPLTRDETVVQLTQLAGAKPPAAVVDRIFARALGQPLFTEQLAAQDAGQPMPAVLADLLDRRLDGLDDDAWAVVRALGVAERPLDPASLRLATGMEDDAIGQAERTLDRRRLLAPRTTSETALRHPLLGDAIRRRLGAGEVERAHRSLAKALAAGPHPSAAEIATHWEAAGPPEQELPWRVRAARDADAHFAVAEASGHWARAMVIWPPGLATVGDPPLRRSQAYVAAVDAVGVLDVHAASTIAERALAEQPFLADLDAAPLLQRAGDLRGNVGRPEDGLELVARSVAIYDAVPPSADHVDALERLEGLLSAAGRRHDARTAAARAVEICRLVDDPKNLRRILALSAWHEAAADERDAAQALMAESLAVEIPSGDPLGDAELGCALTDILLRAAATADEVLAAARPGLESAERWGLSTYACTILRSNVSSAFVRAGRPDRAAEYVTPYVEGEATLNQWPLHLEQATLDLLGGEPASAATRLTELVKVDVPGLSHRAEIAGSRALLLLWTDEPAAALELVLPLLEDTVRTDDVDSARSLLTVAARAAADVRESDPGQSARADVVTHLQELAALVRTDSAGDASVPAQRATWEAELARVNGVPTVAAWVAAIAGWDGLGRPFDAAYCRWRAAQVALSTGDRATADRLLRRAARDARGHGPLRAAITRVAGYAHNS